MKTSSTEPYSLIGPTPLRRTLIFGVWLLWMGVIFCFSTQSWGGAETKSWLDALLTLYLPPVRKLMNPSDLAQLNYIIRKLAHFTEYAILTAVGYWGWFKGVGRSPRQSLRIALLGSVLFAASDEFHQRFVPGRASLLTDVLIDCLGASVAALTLWQWRLRVATSPAFNPEQTE